MKHNQYIHVNNVVNLRRLFFIIPGQVCPVSYLSVYNLLDLVYLNPTLQTCFIINVIVGVKINGSLPPQHTHKATKGNEGYTLLQEHMTIPAKI